MTNFVPYTLNRLDPMLRGGLGSKETQGLQLKAA